MSIYLVGDLHGGQDGSMRSLNTTKFPEQKNLTKDDLVICLGDFGFFWSLIQTKEEKHWIKWLQEKPFQMCFISGNHENHDLIDKEFTDIKFLGAPAQEYKSQYGSIIHLKFGEVYIYEGKKIAVISKAMSQDKIYRTAYIDWWPTEIPSTSEFEYCLQNLNKHDFIVDYVLAHTCPIQVMKPMFGIDDKGKALDPVAKFLDNLIDMDLVFDEFHFGHFHQRTNYGLNQQDYYCHYKGDPFLMLRSLPKELDDLKCINHI